MAWIYLLIASLLETGWTFSLKLLDFKKIRLIEWHSFLRRKENLIILTPLTGYIVFGLGNIYFLSKAMKVIPASTAMAAWLGVALIGVKLVDVLYFKESFQVSQLFYFSLILVGVIGLKLTQ